MLPPNLALEWKLWILLNGLPAIFATTMFLLRPAFAHQFGWNVEPRASGIMMGVGFLMRAAMYVQQFTAPTYFDMKWLHAGNMVFAAVLLGTTCVWGDTFHWRRFIAIAWLFLYIEEPVWMLTLLPKSDASLSGLVGDAFFGASHPLLFYTLLLEAAIMLVFGIALFLWPRFPNIIPWTPDHTSAKILAGWPLSYVLWAPALAFAERIEDSRGGVIVNIIWLAAVALALLIFRNQFDWSKPSAKIIFGGCAGLAALLTVGLVVG